VVTKQSPNWRTGLRLGRLAFDIIQWSKQLSTIFTKISPLRNKNLLSKAN